jgi:CheY-like chemotaxis protein
MADRTQILIVDDDALILKSLKKLLEFDYEVYATTDAFEGLELLKCNPIRLIICDHRMPKMNGLEFYLKVKELYPDKLIYKIIYSGYSEMEKDMFKMIQAQVINEFITKSCPTEMLYKTVMNGIQKVSR